MRIRTGNYPDIGAHSEEHVATQRASKHWWNRQFWENVEGTDSPWTTCCPTEDRLTFELKVEAMVRASIPEDLDRLRAAYQRCNWTDRPKHAICDVYDALVGALYCGESLEANDVLGQLHDFGTVNSETGETFPPPPVILPFPDLHLEDFVRELKYYAFLTVWQFRFKHHHFLKALPRLVESELFLELLEIALREVLDRVRSTPDPDSAGNPEPSPQDPAAAN